MRRLTDILVTAIAPLVWGTNFLLTTDFLPPGRPLLDSLVRSLPIGLLIVAFSRQLPKGDWWWKSAVLAALNFGAFFPLLFFAAYHLPGSVASMLGAAAPVFVIGLAWGMLAQRPVAQTLDLIGERWTILLLRDLLLHGPRRFQDFQASLSGIAPNTLSSRLKAMEDNGLVRRELYSERPPRLEYVLTDKGKSLGPIVKAMRDWGTKNL